MNNKYDKLKKYESINENNKKSKFKYLVLAAALLIGISVFLMAGNKSRFFVNSAFDNSVPQKPATTDPAQETVKLNSSKFSRQAQFFTYKTPDNITVRYFALVDDQGLPHVALDACDVCYGAKKGYVQQGETMICKNCGNAYPIKALGTQNITGGCWPSYIPVTLEGQEVVINVKDLRQKAFMFN
jgi:uncharacterized membrane protein